LVNIFISKVNKETQDYVKEVQSKASSSSGSKKKRVEDTAVQVKQKSGRSTPADQRQAKGDQNTSPSVKELTNKLKASSKNLKK
jgi:hypothetical protein